MFQVLISAVLMISCNAVSAAETAFDRTHASWGELVEKYVHWNAQGTTTQVDYAGFKVDSEQLSDYLNQLSGVSRREFRDWSKGDQYAFLINAYNAATVQLVLTRYPDLTSIKDLGRLFSSPWKKQVLDLLGQSRSLDVIEHELLRGGPDFSDPRVHFAVNCASIGCPALRAEAYVGSRLDAQLEDQTRRFLRDRSRNHLDDSRDQLVISKVFDWYAEDFAAHSGGIRGFLGSRGEALELDETLLRQLRDGELAIGFGEYDWTLNQTHSENAQ